ncbi:MAG TPA: WecB/TagA/CpsF family glycosyltransferase [Candidatus Cybelea sp.]|nr:WecB/TagA/CpsF family glycosyltransferase [Candidatus Cybelea sp.]
MAELPATRTQARQKRPPIAILGVAFDNVTMDETLALIEQMVLSRQPHYVVTANVDFLVQARRDVELRRILLTAHLVLCDGTPLLWLSRLLGNPLPERVAGADLAPLLIRMAAQKGYRLFFLGGTPEVAAKAMANLRAQHPDLIIAGHYSPAFHPLLEMDQDEIARRIREAKPDLLLVSFGCPKAEKWFAMNYRSLGVPVGIGLGATIDFLAGQVKRAPGWMQRTGTEWIFRMVQEPRRLIGRYAADLWRFGVEAPRQWWPLRVRHRMAAVAPPASLLTEHPRWLRITPPSRLDLAVVLRDARLWDRAVQDGRHCLLNMAGVRSLDSSGVGLLISLQKRLQSEGRQLLLVAPTDFVRQTLKRARLNDFFTTARDETTVRERLNTRNAAASTPTLNQFTNTLEWQGEVTAANAETVWNTTTTEIRSRIPPPERFRIDLSRLRFIDSTGLGIMIRARKFARERGTHIVFTNAQANVRNVLRLSRMEAVLLEEPA